MRAGVSRVLKAKWHPEHASTPRRRPPRGKAEQTLWILFERNLAAQKRWIAARRRLRRHKHGWR